VTPINDKIIAAREAAREEARKKQADDYKKRFVDGPVLTIPLEKMQLTFNPNGLAPLTGYGTVYPTMTVSDKWGQISVSLGALLSEDFRRLVVPSPARESCVQGPGWRLSLNKGWSIEPGRRPGDYILKKAGPESSPVKKLP